MFAFLVAAAAIADITHLALVCTGSAEISDEITNEDRHLVIDIEIDGPDGRIRLPREMRPTINNSRGGWFDIANLYINDRRIEGEIKIAPFEKTGFEIDRSTGALETRSGFQAQCERVKATERKF